MKLNFWKKTIIYTDTFMLVSVTFRPPVDFGLMACRGSVSTTALAMERFAQRVFQWFCSDRVLLTQT